MLLDINLHRRCTVTARLLELDYDLSTKLVNTFSTNVMLLHAALLDLNLCFCSDLESSLLFTPLAAAPHLVTPPSASLPVFVNLLLLLSIDLYRRENALIPFLLLKPPSSMISGEG